MTHPPFLHRRMISFRTVRTRKPDLFSYGGQLTLLILPIAYRLRKIVMREKTFGDRGKGVGRSGRIPYDVYGILGLPVKSNVSLLRRVFCTALSALIRCFRFFRVQMPFLG
jgi:hypothetical protein